MLISHQASKIFISIPKTGSTSIMYALNKKSIHPPAIYHASFLEIINFKESIMMNKDLQFSAPKIPFFANFYRKSLLDYQVYAVVRDPIRRLVSVYYDAIADKNHSTLSEISLLGSLSEFFKFYLSKNVFDHPVHLWPQTHFIADVEPKNLHLYNFTDLQNLLDNLQGNFFWKHSKLPVLRKTDSSNAIIDYQSSLVVDVMNHLFEDYNLYNSLPVKNL